MCDATRDVPFGPTDTVPSTEIRRLPLLRSSLTERFVLRQERGCTPSIVRLTPFSYLVGARCLPCIYFDCTMLTAKRLRKVLSYAPTTGIFRWKVSAGSRAPVGAIAGARNGRGYHQIRSKWVVLIAGSTGSALRAVRPRWSTLFGNSPCLAVYDRQVAEFRNQLYQR
jgi:hypothetical protein